MNFSIFHLPRAWDEEHDTPIFDAVVNQSLLADELGYASIFLPEHHFTGYAPIGAGLFATAAFLGAQMKQAYIGTAVTVPPLHHPVRLVEQMNTLDQLTKGRVIFGLGSGGRAEEGIGLGVVHADQMTYMNSENIEIALRLWAKKREDPPVEFETKYYKGVVLQRVVPSSYRKPHPLLMQVAGRESSMLRAAEHGWPCFIGGQNSAVVKPRFLSYVEQLAQTAHAPEVLETALGWCTGVVQVIVVAETEAEAQRDLDFTTGSMERFRNREVGVEARIENMGMLYRRMNHTPFNGPNFVNGSCIYGTPDQVAERIRPFVEMGIGNVIMAFNNGFYSPEQTRITERSMRLFAEEVMPRFAGVPQPTDPRALLAENEPAGAFTERREILA
jgi:alkanesulfonate monooxygenase SsuD/methylene tetrahydromethanopterin reductase-like flavin-dependent oxidoreductase (luciferase family)